MNNEEINYRSVQTLRGNAMEKVICEKLKITQTKSRGRYACRHDGVDEQGNRCEIKTINVNRFTGDLIAGRMREKRDLCDRLVMEWSGRLFDTSAHSNPKAALAVLLTQPTAYFNADLQVNDKSTQQNKNTEILLACEIAETV